MGGSAARRLPRDDFVRAFDDLVWTRATRQPPFSVSSVAKPGQPMMLAPTGSSCPQRVTRLELASPAPSGSMTPDTSVTPQASRRAAVLERMARKSQEKEGGGEKMSSMEKLRRRFALFDTNGDGCLSRQEIYYILTRPSIDGSRAFKVSMYNEVRPASSLVVAVY